MPDARPALLVLDEPTAVLLPDEIEACSTVCAHGRRAAAPSCWSRTSWPRSSRWPTASRCCAAAASWRIRQRRRSDIERLVRAMIQRDLAALDAALARLLGPRSEDARHAARSGAPPRPASGVGERCRSTA